MQRFPGVGGDNGCASFCETRRGSDISARRTKKAAPYVRSSPVCGEKKQSADEPGFVLCLRKVFVIYLDVPSPTHSIVLPSDVSPKRIERAALQRRFT